MTWALRPTTPGNAPTTIRQRARWPRSFSPCLLPVPPGTAPEVEPLTGRIVHVQRSDTLPNNGFRTIEASCEFGDLLLWGACTVDEPMPPDHLAYLFRSGFLDPEQNRPNTWHCAWNHPSSMTPPAVTATAVWLKPPSM